MIQYPSFKQFGAHAAIARWESTINRDSHVEVMRFRQFVLENFPDQITETVPAYHELVMFFKSDISVPDMLAKLNKMYKKDILMTTEKNYLIKIPVCYHNDFALDMDRVVTFSGLSKNEVVQKHIEPQYKVYFLGFLPGFPYLGDLNSEIHTPRLESPREQVSQGAVAVGGILTGIYPSSSPGGWNIIGRTPLRLFDLNTPNKTLLKAGDSIKFKPISKKEFSAITKQVKNYTFTVEREVCYD